MGIKHLRKFLLKHAPHVYHDIHISQYQNKRIAVDILLYLYKFKTVHQSRWIVAFLNMISMLRRHNIQGIFVYDTKADVMKADRIKERHQRRSNASSRIETLKQDLHQYKTTHISSSLLVDIMKKNETHVARLLRPQEDCEIKINQDIVDNEIHRLEKQTVFITREDINLTKKLLDLIGVVYLNAPHEAETMCCYLCHHGQVDAVLSNDTDVLAYGTPLFLCDLKKEIVSELNFEQVLTALELNYNEFRDFCILCGTDYNNNIYRIGSEKAFKLIKKYRSIESIGEQEKRLDISVLKHIRVRQLFTLPEDPPNVDLEEKPPNLNELELFLIQNNCSLDFMLQFSDEK